MCRKAVSNLENIRPRLEVAYIALLEEDLKSMQSAASQLELEKSLKTETDRLQFLKSNDSKISKNSPSEMSSSKYEPPILNAPTCNYVPIIDTEANDTLKALRDRMGMSSKILKVESPTTNLSGKKYFSENGTILRPVHVPQCLISRFLQIASQNTQKNLETCAVLAGKLNHDEFTITSLIVPKQVATSDTCAMINEEEIISAQDKLDVMSLGWIHVFL
jgi:hypothetical protein